MKQVECPAPFALPNQKGGIVPSEVSVILPPSLPESYKPLPVNYDEPSSSSIEMPPIYENTYKLDFMLINNNN